MVKLARISSIIILLHEPEGFIMGELGAFIWLEFAHVSAMIVLLKEPERSFIISYGRVGSLKMARTCAHLSYNRTFK